jgi:predicted metal-dependent phosphoesterase TrpH
MHTTCSDGQNTYEEMVQAALEQGIDFIAITDHRFDGRGRPCRDDTGKCDDKLCQAVIAACRQETRLLCIPGMEITGRVHMVALGIQHGIAENLSVKEWVLQIHEQGGFAIAAHPYEWTPPYTEAELSQSGLDAMECRGGQWVNGKWVADNTYGIPCVYSSDAHSASQLGRGYLVCDAVVKTFDALKAAIRANKCHAP